MQSGSARMLLLLSLYVPFIVQLIGADSQIGTAMPAEPEAREKILHKLLDLHSVLPPREETQRRAKHYFASCQWL